MIRRVASIGLLILFGIGDLSRAEGDHQIEPHRYTNSNGVEVITSRESKTVALPADRTKSTSPGVNSQVRASGEPHPSAQDQAKSQRDRLAILNKELSEEGTILLAKRRALSSPRVGLDLSPEQITELQKQVVRHEENVRALSREIAREPPQKPS